MVAGGSRIPAASSLAASVRRKASACGDTWHRTSMNNRSLKS